MTAEELATTISTLKYNYLVVNHAYANKYRLGSLTTIGRLRDLLDAVDIYLQILDYYANIPSTELTLASITEDDILVIIAEADKLLDTYKLYYESR